MYGDDYPNRFRPRPIKEPLDPGYVLDFEGLARPIDREALYGRNAPLVVEIGHGRGVFLCEQAKRRPDLDFIGIEYKLKRVHLVARKVVRQELRNVRLVWTEARAFVETYLAPGSVQSFHVHFPDPWPKRKHRRRRLLTGEFITLLVDRFEPGGELTVATDDREYALETAALLAADERLTTVLGADPIQDRIDGYPPTHFELKYREEGRPLYFMRFRRIPEAG